MAEVLLSPLAESDLREVWFGIAVENRAAADRFVRRLTARIASLADFPAIGAPRPDLAPNARVLVEASTSSSTTARSRGSRSFVFFMAQET